jgi:hypothetical protein
MSKYSELVDELESWAQNEEMIDSYFLPHGEDCKAAAAALRELGAERDRLREAHKRNIEDAVKGRYDEGHRCKWRILFEAVESRSRAALEETMKHE